MDKNGGYSLPKSVKKYKNYSGFERAEVCPLSGETGSQIYKNEHQIWMNHDFADFYPLLDKWYPFYVSILVWYPFECEYYSGYLGTVIKKNIRNWPIY